MLAQVEVDEKVWRNLKQFTTGKRKDEDIFNQLTTSSLNAHLKNLMPGLTAKVFRTFNASYTLEKELEKAGVKEDDPVEEKYLAFTRANRQVAILCNHQKSVNKKHEEQVRHYAID